MIIKAVKLLIATIGLCLGSAAMAENLVYIQTDAPGSDYYYDAETIRRYSNDTVLVWIKREATKDKTVSYRNKMMKLKIDCSAETYGSLYVSMYRANGTVMDSASTDNPNMSPVTPGTIGDSVFKIMCPK
jgi:hypothetical protein